jgi:hypothetical protein
MLQQVGSQGAERCLNLTKASPLGLDSFDLLPLGAGGVLTNGSPCFCAPI